MYAKGGNMREDVTLQLATEKDAKRIHQMKYEAFLPLYEKYRDDETSPAKEGIEKVRNQLREDRTDYYLIQCQGEIVGAVRVRKGQEMEYHISPLFILPEHQKKGIAYAAIQRLFQQYKQAVVWKLATILQEKGNCHLYEKCGFQRVGEENVINERMTIIGYERMTVTTRRFEDKDAVEVHSLIIRNFKEVNIKDYGEKAIEELVQTHDVEWLRNIASYANMYVFLHGEKIVGTGSISSFWGSKTESILLTVFVLPEYHGKGIGRKIIQTLEQDELFLRAERIEIPASITGAEFYRKFGYEYKNGVKELDNEGHYRLEKFRKDNTYEIGIYEELSLNSHPAIQTKCYDGWLLRFSNGYTARANSVNMLYPSTIDLQTKIKECEEQYSMKQLPCIFKIIDGSHNILDEMLQKRGYKVVTPTDLLVLDLAKTEFTNKACIIANGATEEWLHAFFKLKKFADHETCNTATQIYHLIQNETLYCQIEQEGVCVACASAVIERGYVFIANVIVDEKHRCKGYGRQLCEALLAEAKERGAHTAYLQVVQSNQIAYNLYKKLGYQKVYSYWYRKKELEG